MNKNRHNYNQIGRTDNGVLMGNWYEEQVLRKFNQTTFDRTMINLFQESAEPTSKDFAFKK